MNSSGRPSAVGIGPRTSYTRSTSGRLSVSVFAVMWLSLVRVALTHRSAAVRFDTGAIRNSLTSGRQQGVVRRQGQEVDEGVVEGGLGEDPCRGVEVVD